MLRRVAAATGLLLLGAAAASADVATDWDRTALGGTTRSPPFIEVRALAIAHGAMFDAVNAVTRSYLAPPETAAGTSKDAAAAAAVPKALMALYPGERRLFDSTLQALLAKIADGQGKDDGVPLGRQVAERHLASRDEHGALIGAQIAGIAVGRIMQPPDPVRRAAPSDEAVAALDRVGPALPRSVSGKSEPSRFSTEL